VTAAYQKHYFAALWWLGYQMLQKSAVAVLLLLQQLG
jgi:hypothetical protein